MTPIPHLSAAAARGARTAAAALLPLLLLLLLGAPGSPLHAQASPELARVPAPERHAAAVDRGRELLSALVRDGGIVGLSVAVAVDGEVVWAEGFGFADLEAGVPVTPITKFRIGSVSKPLTSMAMGRLHEEGKMDFDRVIQAYVPYFPEKRWFVTVRQLAGHLGGVRSYDYADFDPQRNEFLSVRHYDSVRDALGIFMRDSLLHEPGTEYEYSSNGWNLLSAAVEGASEQDFLTYMRDNVLDPLGMQQTVPDHADRIVPHRTRFYMRMEDGAVRNARFADLSNKWAGGGYLSTPTDLVRWGSALLEPGAFLESETIELLWRPQRTQDGESTGYGIGWGSGEAPDGRRTIGHGGGSVGGRTSFVIYPEDGVVVAMTINMSVAPVGGLTSHTVAEPFLDPATGRAATATDLASWPAALRYTVDGEDGAETEGTIELWTDRDGPGGIIRPDAAPSEPERSQDGSYSLALPQRIRIARVEREGTDGLRLVGADPSGFVVVRLRPDGDGWSGSWRGRDVTGAVRASASEPVGG